MTQDISANVKWRVSDQLFVELDAHMTEAEADQEMWWSGNRTFADFGYDFADIENPAVNLFLDPASNPNIRGGASNTPTNLADPASAFFLFAADQFKENDGDLQAFRGDVEYEFDNDGWFDAVKVGARFSEREQNNREAGLNWAGVAPPWSGAGAYLPYSASAVPNETVDLSNFQRGGVVVGDNTSVVFPGSTVMDNYDTFVSLMTVDPLIPVNEETGALGDWTPLRQNGVVDYSRGAISNVAESTTNLYARLDFGNEFGNGTSLEGNVGVRYVSTDVSGVGQDTRIALAGEPSPATFNPELGAYLGVDSTERELSAGYEYVLPSINLKFNLTDDMLIRFAASQAITPPNIADLNANQTQIALLNYVVNTADPANPIVTNITPEEIRVYGGNPQLKPVEALNIDLSYEYYFGDDGQFSVSAFHKDLKNIIVYGSENQGTVTLDGNVIPINYYGNTNLNDGNLTGAEFAYQQFFTELPGILSNLGVQANYTYIMSESTALPGFIDADGDGNADSFEETYRFGINQLLGLSDHSYNLIGIYQSDDLELRLAYNWRSEFFSSYRDFVTGNPIIQDDVGFLDASARYDITDSLQIRLQAANLLDTKSIAYQQLDQAGQRFGRANFLGDRRLEIGVSYSY